MPTSREEIAEVLKEAAEFGKRVGCKHANWYFLKRAALVESMLCETCKYYDKEFGSCEIIGSSDGIIHPYFGCFLHEQKPAG